MVDGVRPAICCSCIAVSLRRHVQCLVWWNQAGLACDCTLRFGLRLLFLAMEIKQLPRLLMFALSALFVASLSAAQRSAAESVRHARDDLDVTVQELKRINEALQAENAESKRAEDALHHAQLELAHVTRVTTPGE
jgi:hypothetical protein